MCSATFLTCTRIVFQNNDPIKALSMYRRVLVTSPSYADAWHLLGLALHSVDYENGVVGEERTQLTTQEGFGFDRASSAAKAPALMAVAKAIEYSGGRSGMYRCNLAEISRARGDLATGVRELGVYFCVYVCVLGLMNYNF